MLALSESSLKLRSACEQQTQLVSKACDVWSTGCLLAELFSGAYLFADRTWPDLYVALCLSTDIELPLDPLREAMLNLDYRIPRFVEKLITAVLRRDPQDRMSIAAQREAIDQFVQETHLLSVSSKGAARPRPPDFSPRHLPQRINSKDSSSARSVHNNKSSINSPELFDIPRFILRLYPAVCLNFGFNRLSHQRHANYFLDTCSDFELLTGTELTRIQRTKLSSSIALYASRLTYATCRDFCDVQESEFVEIRLCPGGAKKGKTNTVYFDSGADISSEDFKAAWRDLLLFCLKHVGSGFRIMISMGVSENETVLTVLDERERRPSLLSALDDATAYCTCAKRTITCAAVLASLLGNPEARQHGDGDAQNPNQLSAVDRGLPGISQVCCQETARVLFRL